MKDQQTLPSEGFVKLPQILTAIPVSKSTWFRGIAAGKYPRPVKLGQRCSGWDVMEIRQCIERLQNPTNDDHDNHGNSKRRETRRE